MRLDLGLDAVERLDVAGRQDLFGRPGGQHRAILQQHQRPAQAGGEVEVVGRDDDSDRGAALEVAQERGDFELVGQIERGRGLVEQQNAGVRQ